MNSERVRVMVRAQVGSEGPGGGSQQWATSAPCMYRPLNAVLSLGYSSVRATCDEG